MKSYKDKIAEINAACDAAQRGNLYAWRFGDKTRAEYDRAHYEILETRSVVSMRAFVDGLHSRG